MRVKKFVIVMMLVGCVQPSGQVVKTETDNYTLIGGLDGAIRSVNHDGHLYTVATTTHGVSIIQ